MDRSSISAMGSDELRRLVQSRELDELDALAVLRNPYCTVDIAELICDNAALLDLHDVRERLSGFRGMSLARAMNLMATLPWVSLLRLSQQPATPPQVRRQAERKLLERMQRMSLGEKIALARRCHRPLIRPLVQSCETQVLEALLDNPRLVENDLLVVLNTASPPAPFFATLARHRRWGPSYQIRRALVENARTPLPVALSALVQLRPSDLDAVASRRDVPEGVRDAARALGEKRREAGTGSG